MRWEGQREGGRLARCDDLELGQSVQNENTTVLRVVKANTTQVIAALQWLHMSTLKLELPESGVLPLANFVICAWVFVFVARSAQLL